MNKIEEFLKQCIVLDTETTSDDYKIAEIIESGFVTRNNNQEWDIYQQLHKPADPIPPKIESICYITNEMVNDHPPFSDTADKFQSIVDNFADGYVVAHNYFYDQRVLQNHGITLPEKSICTWRMAKKLFMNTPEIAETNLPYLRFALKLDVPIKFHCHRAGYDSLITGELLESMILLLEGYGIVDTSQDIGPQIHEYANSPIIYEKMPFGKYKGELMSSIPMSYWQWAMNNTHWFDETADNFDPDLMASIHKSLENQ